MTAAPVRFLRRRWEKNGPELSAALRGGFPDFVRARRPAELGHDVPVFVFHLVDRAGMEADLRFLRDNGYVALSADELLAHLRGERPAPERAVVLSFDDGPVNLHRVAFPLLREFRQKAVAFVAPAFHDVPADRLRHRRRPCSWDELREMHGSGLVDVQSHTYEHRFLPRWPEPVPLAGVDPEFHRTGRPATSIEHDFALARARLEEQLGSDVRHLAFPRFQGTGPALDAAHDAGYRACWWGALPRRPANRPGDDGGRIVRLSAEFLRRLPGRGRSALAPILARRYARALRLAP